MQPAHKSVSDTLSAVALAVMALAALPASAREGLNNPAFDEKAA